jgi:hypothetical protein
MGDINKVMIAEAGIAAGTAMITPERQLLMDHIPMN